jgi:hypothetical protein
MLLIPTLALITGFDWPMTHKLLRGDPFTYVQERLVVPH